MRYLILTAALWAGSMAPAWASGGHDHGVPTLSGQTTTTVSMQGDTLTLTFGPIDLPSSHDGELAASMPKHIFEVPADRYLVAYRSSVFTKDGKTLPGSISTIFCSSTSTSKACPVRASRCSSPAPAWR